MARRLKQKLAYMQFFPTDWRSDPRLRMCSAAARGLWIEMMCLMHEAEPYGHLIVSGQRPTDAQLAVLAGIPSDQITDLLGELETAGVFSRTSQGAIYSRRMTRDEKKRRIARKNGKSGGNPSLRKKRGNPASDNPQDKGQDKTQRPETRDQSISSSSSSAREPSLFDRVWERAGVSRLSHVPSYWMPPAAELLVTGWRDLGLSDEEILSVVDARMKAKGEQCPDGPKAFSRDMQRLAGAKSAPALTPIDGGRHDGPAGQSPRERQAEDKLRRDLAFADDLDRKRGGS